MINWIGWLTLSLILTLILEMIKFQSIKKAFHFAKQRPLYFGINFLIVSATFAFSFFVSRKIFLIMTVLFFWLALSIINAIVTHLRGYPLMFSDIFLIKEGLSLSSHYFKPSLIIGLLLLMVGIGYIIYYCYQLEYAVDALDYLLALVYVTVAGFIFNRIEKGQIIEQKPKESEEIGFAYAMADSIYPYINRKPDEYHEKVMKEISHHLLPMSLLPPTVFPQLIILQLESFFDPLKLNGVTFSEDPIPTFRSLMKTGNSGQLNVPTFGGGTAKTEFSVLTAMNAKLLKPGEIPHNSFLKHTPLESLATQLQPFGYEATLIHNYEGNFYHRELAYSNLGFSRYIPIEYMSGINQAHDLAQMKDADLINYVIKTLETDDRAFIYGITAGTHQPYDELVEEESDCIKISGIDDETMQQTLTNYVKRLHLLDQEINRLMKYLEETKKETILIMFSDHLPNLPILSSSKHYGDDPFEVDYFMTSFHSKLNVHVPRQLECYQLGGELMNLMSIPLSLMQRIHETYATHPNYQDILRLCQYDLIEGKGYLYNHQPSLQPTVLKFGLHEQSIKRCEWVEAGLLIHGTGFNIDSQLYLDDKKMETIFMSETQLFISTERKEIKKVTLKQLSRRHHVLGEAIDFIIEDDSRVDNKK